ncbi:unnamed protein product [Staurois parvus]|uniref:Uncharacterized protein n=1 Tax=Staurois parvus TaxID=386267 RepID=A0ABN9CQ31_9NEOB|nr:unnamed protein product [Staurois parvus]
MTHSGPGSSMRRRYRGPWQITAWQQHEESAVQGPMTQSGPGSSMGRPVQGPMTDYGPGSSIWSRYGGP